MKKYSTEDIDRYIHNEMSPSEKQQWDKERKSEKILDREINLYIDIERALREKDIILLRKALLKIIKIGYSPEDDENCFLCEPSEITKLGVV